MPSQDSPYIRPRTAKASNESYQTADLQSDPRQLAAQLLNSGFSKPLVLVIAVTRPVLTAHMTLYADTRISAQQPCIQCATVPRAD